MGWLLPSLMWAWTLLTCLQHLVRLCLLRHISLIVRNSICVCYAAYMCFGVGPSSEHDTSNSFHAVTCTSARRRAPLCHVQSISNMRLDTTQEQAVQPSKSAQLKPSMHRLSRHAQAHIESWAEWADLSWSRSHGT